ncbi:MAG: AraC-like DNA-binding protein [Saprospiraceae bacterium]|jgi:AraC-like DNA-binding protein
MQVKNYIPSLALLQFVESYSFYYFDNLSEEVLTVRDFPRTAKDMIFCFEGNLEISVQGQNAFKVAEATFINNFDRPYDIVLRGNLSIMHIRFKPNGIYPLTKIPLFELLNGQLPLEDLTDKNISFLHQEMHEQTSDLQRIAIFEKYLLKRYATANLHYRLDGGLQIIQSKKGLLTVSELSNTLNTNYKSIDRWFKKHVGLPPKKFMQITRFKNILEDLEHQTQPDWMQIVSDYNFHDQAHFIKDFSRFAGVSPGIFSK